MKLSVMSLKRLQDAGDWFLLSYRLNIVFAKMGRHVDTGHELNNIIFYVHIEQSQTDRRILVNFILQVEELTFTAEVQSIVYTV
jgi:hypothetical protein